MANKHTFWYGAVNVDPRGSVRLSGAESPRPKLPIPLQIQISGILDAFIHCPPPLLACRGSAAELHPPQRPSLTYGWSPAPMRHAPRRSFQSQTAVCSLIHSFGRRPFQTHTGLFKNLVIQLTAVPEPTLKSLWSTKRRSMSGRALQNARSSARWSALR
jgi:hypothetical protein